MKLEKEEALLEAILFLESDPVDLNSLIKITDFSKEAVLQALANLKEKFSQPDRGLELLEIGGGYQFAPKIEYWDYLKGRYGKKNENRLSRAAMETLSIIAYSQPVTRAEIENIRGVSSDGMLRLLMGRKLVKEAGKKDTPGKPVTYGTTQEFLTFFKLKSISDLPKLSDTDLKRFELNG
ncbi:MAG: SMC-Scp complex subunit ScpB [Spirochaetales bacterium]|jgi:segregation and condensation protein B|nr:SMC-Scp complex subunit ScpB [Spirochaetales bacterium]